MGPAKGDEGLHCFALSLSMLASLAACCISSSQRTLETLSGSWEYCHRIQERTVNDDEAGSITALQELIFIVSTNSYSAPTKHCHTLYKLLMQ